MEAILIDDPELMRWRRWWRRCRRAHGVMIGELRFIGLAIIAGRDGLGERILRAADLAVDIGAVLDRQRLVDDVALDMAAGQDMDMDAADRPDYPAPHQHLLGIDL